MNKRTFLTLGLAVISMALSAQLPYDHEFTKNDFDNAQTVLETENASWALTGGISVGKTILFGEAIESYVVIALPQDGVPEKLRFNYTSGAGTLSVYESTDHRNWSGMWTMDVTSLISLFKSDSVNLKPTTRYLKFAYRGKSTMNYSKIYVRELKKLECSTESLQFEEAYVDAATETQTVYINWSNIVTNVTSSNPAFTASLTQVGSKNLLNQSTALQINYSHAEAGEHSGQIVLEGEGRRLAIQLSGKTKKYDQSIHWSQTFGTIKTTDDVLLNATSTSGLEVVYESDNEQIAHVDADGRLVITKAGEVTLTATQPGNYKYNEAESISKTITIEKTTPEIALTCANLIYGSSLGEAELQETRGEVAGSLSWVGHADTEVLNAGSYLLDVLFTPANEDLYNRVTMPVSLTVEKAPQFIVWDIDETTTMQVGETLNSTAAATSGLPLTYAFTDCILGIEEGVITAEEAGAVIVIAFQEGNENYLPTTVLIRKFTIESTITTAIQRAQQAAEAEKRMQEGLLLIQKEGRSYDATGKRW